MGGEIFKSTVKFGFIEGNGVFCRKEQGMNKDFEGSLEDFNKLSIAELENLETIDLENKGLKKIPNNVFLAKNIKHLWLENNNISEIPSSITNLNRLEKIHLTNNLLQDIPPSILKLEKLSGLFIDKNPLEENADLFALNSLQVFSDIGMDGERGEITLSIIKYIYNLVPVKNKKYFTLQIEKELQTPILHYLLFFKDYVKGAKKKNIHFEVERVGEDALTLVTNGRNEVTVEEMREYFEEYVDLTRTKMDDWVLNVSSNVTRNEGDILRLKLENEVGRFKNAYKIAQLENNKLQKEIDFLQRLSLNLSERHITLNLKSPEKK